jgi:hypothetical protein
MDYAAAVVAHAQALQVSGMREIPGIALAARRCASCYAGWVLRIGESMNAGDVTATVSVLAAIAGLLVAYATYRYTVNSKDSWAKTDDAFSRSRNYLKSNRASLQAIAQQSQHKLVLISGIPLLIKPGWIPALPLPFDAVGREWVEPGVNESEMRAAFDPARKVTRRYWTRASEYLDTYHDVIERLENPDKKLFFDGSSYRLLDVTVAAGDITVEKIPITLTFTPGRYFDALDTTDVLGYETALLALRPRQRNTIDLMRGRYRRWLGSPFDLTRRCAIPGVNTLTIRRGLPAPSFILHERNPRQVALSQGVAHVTPAGEFQPRDLSNLASIVDLDLWSTVKREYAEELLGITEAQGQSLEQRPSDRLNDVMSALDEAHGNGGVVTRFLGIGLDPLTWKPEILTVAIFEPNVYDTIFRDIIKENDEGRIIFRDDSSQEGFPFTEDRVKDFTNGTMLPAGTACLVLAWKRRRELGIRDLSGR